MSDEFLENPDEKLDAFRKELARREEADLGLFIQHAWHEVEPSPFVPGWHLDAIVDHLSAVTAGDIRNLLINLPPRHAKSLTVAVFWPVWEWIANPQRRWLFTSYALQLSIRDSVRCRRLIVSDWFQRRWADRFALMPDQNAKERFDNDRGGVRLATSVGAAVTGEGGDRVVVDDPHNLIDIESRATREATLEWWDQAMSTRMNDPKTAARVIVMQRLHERDLSGHVLEQGGYLHLCLPAEFEPARRCATAIGWQDPRTLAGELLWPERVGPPEIAGFKRSLGPIGFAGQFQQHPTPAKGARFLSDWFRYYRTDTVGDDVIYSLLDPAGGIRRVSANDCIRFAVMDPAGTEASQNRRACYTVIQVWDVTDRREMILVDQYRKQVQTPDVVAAAEEIIRQRDPAYLGVEREGIGLGVVQTLRRRGVTVKPLIARGSKEARSESAEIRMAAGDIYFPQDAEFLYELQRELLLFPNSEYADQVDALAHAAIEVQKRGGPSEPDAVERTAAPVIDAWVDVVGMDDE
ncbi:MAG TPA: phage terminase large subunit [Tepidisphaeraceae bacterium]|nr:phage terminase large subunit [Tepidisphaeraceae bacterium]